MEHTDDKDIARRIALDHIVERLDYYDQLDKIEKMEKGGLIAPNGNESNLTPKQYKLVRTEAFKNWFGDWENDPENASKVVDENGEPLVMYHGTQNTFTIFEMDYIETGIDDKELKSRFWFTKNKELAESYSLSRVGDSKLYEVFLNIRKPKNNDFNLYIKDNNDGAIEYNGLKNISVAITISSNQIKLANGTNTTFDGGNPDIRFEKGGLLDFISSKSLIVKIGNDSYKIQYQKDEIGSTEKNVWFANVIAKNEIEVKGRLCYADEYVAVIHGMNLNDVTDEIMDFYKSNDLYLIIQDEFGKVTETRHIESNDSNMFAKGGRTIAQTPAPKSDRVSGSKTNPKGSASDSYLGKSIKFNDALTKAIQNKVDEYNEKHPSDKVSLATAKAVVRRGFGAYSKSHRPTITGGAPNSRQAWGLARLNKFLIKKSGGKVKSAYIQDDDLL
jgi:hypothetical protein